MEPVGNQIGKPAEREDVVGYQQSEPNADGISEGNPEDAQDETVTSAFSDSSDEDESADAARPEEEGKEEDGDAISDTSSEYDDPNRDIVGIALQASADDFEGFDGSYGHLHNYSDEIPAHPQAVAESVSQTNESEDDDDDPRPSPGGPEFSPRTKRRVRGETARGYHYNYRPKDLPALRKFMRKGPIRKAMDKDDPFYHPESYSQSRSAEQIQDQRTLISEGPEDHRPQMPSPQSTRRKVVEELYEEMDATMPPLSIKSAEDDRDCSDQKSAQESEQKRVGLDDDDADEEGEDDLNEDSEGEDSADAAYKQEDDEVLPRASFVSPLSDAADAVHELTAPFVQDIPTQQSTTDALSNAIRISKDANCASLSPDVVSMDDTTAKTSWEDINQPSNRKWDDDDDDEEFRRHLERASRRNSEANVKAESQSRRSPADSIDNSKSSVAKSEEESDAAKQDSREENEAMKQEQVLPAPKKGMAASMWADTGMNASIWADEHFGPRVAKSTQTPPAPEPVPASPAHASPEGPSTKADPASITIRIPGTASALISKPSSLSAPAPTPAATLPIVVRIPRNGPGPERSSCSAVAPSLSPVPTPIPIIVRIPGTGSAPSSEHSPLSVTAPDFQPAESQFTKDSTATLTSSPNLNDIPDRTTKSSTGTIPQAKSKAKKDDPNYLAVAKKYQDQVWGYKRQVDEAVAAQNRYRAQRDEANIRKTVVDDALKQRGLEITKLAEEIDYWCGLCHENAAELQNANDRIAELEEELSGKCHDCIKTDLDATLGDIEDECGPRPKHGKCCKTRWKVLERHLEVEKMKVHDLEDHKRRLEEKIVGLEEQRRSNHEARHKRWDMSKKRSDQFELSNTAATEHADYGYRNLLLQAELDELKGKIESVESSEHENAREEDATERQYAEQIGELMKDFENLQDELDDCRKYRETANASNKENERLKKELEDLGKQLQESRQQLVTLASSNVETELSKKNNLENLQKQLKQCRQLRDTLERDMQRLYEEKEGLENALAKSRNLLQAYEEDIEPDTEFEHDLDADSLNNRELKKKLTDCWKKAQRLDARLANCREQVRMTDEKYARLSKETDELKSENYVLNMMSESSSILQQQWDDNVEQRNDKYTELEIKYNEVVRKIKELEDMRNNSENQERECLKEKEGLQQRIQDLETELKTTQDYLQASALPAHGSPFEEPTKCPTHPERANLVKSTFNRPLNQHSNTPEIPSTNGDLNRLLGPRTAGWESRDMRWRDSHTGHTALQRLRDRARRRDDEVNTYAETRRQAYEALTGNSSWPKISRDEREKNYARIVGKYSRARAEVAVLG